jgi:hypothetical protein
VRLLCSASERITADRRSHRAGQNGQHALVNIWRRATASAFVLIVAACGGSSGNEGSESESRSTSATTQVTFKLPPVSVIGGSTIPSTVVDAKPLPSGMVASALDIAAGIKAAGIGCEDASLVGAAFPDDPRNPTKEQVSCDIGDDNVDINLFADHDALGAALPMVQTMGCTSASRQDTNLSYVEGDNWIVFSEHRATAEQIAEALDAALRTISC